MTYLTILEIVSINRPTRISDNFYEHFPSCFFFINVCFVREDCATFHLDNVGGFSIISFREIVSCKIDA